MTETRRSYGLRHARRASQSQSEVESSPVEPPSKRRKINTQPKPPKQPTRSAKSKRSKPRQPTEEELAPALESADDETETEQIPDDNNVSDIPIESVENLLGPEKALEESLSAALPQTQDSAAALVTPEKASQRDDHNHIDEEGGAPQWDENLEYQLVDGKRHLQRTSLTSLKVHSQQLLSLLGQGSFQDAIDTVQNASSDRHEIYNAVRPVFSSLKRIYCGGNPFISCDDFGILDPQDRDTIREANLATFIASISGSQEAGFYHMNQYFLEIFVSNDLPLTQQVAKLYIDLKTHAYFSATANEAQSLKKDQLLEDLFPLDFEQRLLWKKPDSFQLNDIESDFVKALMERRDILSKSSSLLEASPYLGVCDWDSFLKGINALVKRNIAAFSQSYFPMEQKPQLSNDEHLQVLAAITAGEDSSALNLEEAAAHAAEVAMASYFESTGEDGAGDQSVVQDGSIMNGTGLKHDISAPESSSDIPYPSQTAPTQVLYERARLAASAKASPNNRRAGLPSQRRAWTPEEENALMAGLDRVKGPHWSQILAMFGQNGTINETLKDRNQVQLKDKARNLKLFFLKNEIEVPYYLQFVTGELKTRAPGQAAKNEAKERKKIQVDEDKAHIEGILALAAGNGRANSSDTIVEGQEHEQAVESQGLSADDQHLMTALESVG